MKIVKYLLGFRINVIIYPVKIENIDFSSLIVCQLPILYPTYDVDQSYRQGSILDIALWLGQYHDIALWYS